VAGQERFGYGQPVVTR